MFKISIKKLKYVSFFLSIIFVCLNYQSLTLYASEETIDIDEDGGATDININDAFDEKSLIVVLKPSKSRYYSVITEFIDKLHSIEEVESYDDLSELSVDSLDEKGIGSTNYNAIEKHLSSIEFKQILKINLKNT